MDEWWAEQVDNYWEAIHIKNFSSKTWEEENHLVELDLEEIMHNIYTDF